MGRTERLPPTRTFCGASPMHVGDTTLQQLLDKASVNRPELYDELLQRACERLRLLARKRLRGFAALRRWVETDDVLQQAMLRLHRNLKEVKPATVKDFFGLAALQIRRELLDLHRHFLGPEGEGANHHTDGAGKAADDEGGPLNKVAEDGNLPVAWDFLHDLIEALPDDEREIVDLLFVHELTQEEAGQVLGVSLRTVKRRWQSARIALQEAIEKKAQR